MVDLLSSLLHFVLAIFIPVVGLGLAGALMIYGVYVRWIDIPGKWLLTTRALQVLIAVAVLFNAWTALRLYLAYAAQQTW